MSYHAHCISYSATAVQASPTPASFKPIEQMDIKNRISHSRNTNKREAQGGPVSSEVTSRKNNNGTQTSSNRTLVTASSYNPYGRSAVRTKDFSSKSKPDRTTPVSGQVFADGDDDNALGTSPSSREILLPPLLERQHNGDLTQPGAQAIPGIMYGRGDEVSEEQEGTFVSGPETTVEGDLVLTVAHKVEEIFATETVNVDKQRKEEQKRRRRLFICGFLTAGVVIGVAVGLGVYFGMDNSVRFEPPSVAPTQAPTFTIAGIRDFVQQLSSPRDLQNVTSPQFRAFTWILQDVARIETSRDVILQRYVMAVVYYALDGDNWQTNEKWLSKESICSWHSSGGGPGTICSDDGILKVFDLNRNNLQGTLPTELALLSDQLVKVDVTLNQVSGTIPTELGQLSRLEVFFVAANKITGTVPSEIGRMTSMINMYFDSNLMVGTMPQQVCALKNETLQLLWADCFDEIACDCCGRCCRDDMPCNDQDGTVPPVPTS